MGDWAGDWDASKIWKFCYDCNKGVRESNWAAHLRTHIDRPSDDAMTPGEVAKALGISPRTVRWRIEHGHIRHFTTTTGRNKVWVRREEVTRLTTEMAQKAGAAVVSFSKGTVV